MALFPENINPWYSYTITSRWFTLVVGKDDATQRRRKRTTPLYDISLTYGILTKANEQVLFDFFNARSGRWQTFSIYDFESRTWTGESFGTGDAVEDTFDAGAKSISSYTVYNDGTALTEAVDYTVGTGLGTDSQDQIVFTTPPADGNALTITYTGQKYFNNCLFKSDSYDREEFKRRLYRLGLEIEQVTG